MQRPQGTATHRRGLHAIVAAGRSECMVAMLAVPALGAAAVSNTLAPPVKEVAYFLEKSRAVPVLVSTFDLKKCSYMEKCVVSTSNKNFRVYQ
ncbi:hypothetical protein J1614_004091 [Plenodomus biglobosus]|nr:hypothetical protein J1614_004091 [Plenodomus biglobosus]